MRGITSIITPVEILVNARASGDVAAEQYFRDLLSDLSVEAFGEAIADRAISLRAHFGLKAPDAIQAATAIESNCDALITEDQDFLRIQSEIAIIMPSRLTR